MTAYYLGETGNEDTNITRILDRYAGESSHFNLAAAGPGALPPPLPSSTARENACSSSVILVCGDRSVVVDYSSLYEVDYNTYYTTGSLNYTFMAEPALTGAISRVTSDSSYLLYQLSGHGELELGSDSDRDADQRQRDGGKPEPAFGRQHPGGRGGAADKHAAGGLLGGFHRAAAQLPEGGGRLLVTTSLTYDTPNLDALLAEYGLSRQSGLLVDTDANLNRYTYTPPTCCPPCRSTTSPPA